MAFGSRNSLLSLFLAVGLGLAAVSGAGAVVLLVRLAGGEPVNFFESHPFWFTYTVVLNGALENVFGCLALAAAGVATFAVGRVFFKRVGQAEVFFIVLFLFSFIPECLRLATLGLQSIGAPSVIGLVMSRLVHGARIFGLLSLLFGSLYALELQYQKFEIVIAVMLGAALLFAFVLPFDAELLLTNGLFKVGDEQALFVIQYGLIAVCGINYALSLFRGRPAVVPAALLLLLLGRETLAFALSPIALLAGGAVCAGGALLLFKGCESNYSLT